MIICDYVFFTRNARNLVLHFPMAMKNSILWELYGDESVNGSMMLEDYNVEESENPENDLLEDLDSYLEDINDRLTISRMVSDSVIKGMVSAVEQEAAERIAKKELELARLKETLHLYHVGSEESESFGSMVMQHELGTAKCRTYSSVSDALSHYKRIGESLGSLKNVAKDQLKNLRKEIDRIKGSCSMRMIGSGSEMVGFGGILQDKVSDIKWMDVDKTLNSLRATLDTICKHVDNLVYSSKASLCQWQQEKEFRGEIEDMVIMNYIRSLKEEFEERLWDQSARFYDKESLNCLEKIKEISSLRQELNAISKSLSVPEMGHITFHGSMEISEEWDTDKRTDHLHCKISGNHTSLSTSLQEGNGKHDDAMPENLDVTQLKHMTKEELVNYFKSEMTKMKRDHEHKVQEMTEKYFSLKRRGSSLRIKKDEEFDILRKKIPEVILKLDDILVENEKLPEYSKDAGGLSSLTNRLETLLLENRQLRSSLANKKREVKCLSLQVSETAEMILQHSVAEARLAKRIDNLQCALDDAHTEASITEDVYKCLLKEVVDCQKSAPEQSDVEYNIMLEIYEIKCEFEDSDLESLIMQELCGVILTEALKEAEVKLNELNLAYSNEMELRVSVEKEALEKEGALRLEVAEVEKLKQETLLLSSLMGKKEKLANETTAALVKDKEQIELYKMEVHELKQKLELAIKKLRETIEEKRMLLSLAEAKEREQSKQMQSLIILIQWLSKAGADFECRVMEDIKRSNSRLDSLCSQSRALYQQAKDIKRMGLNYKQKLERRSSDLQKAEAEVDLLGNEVDTLLSLLEKIYIALDHYSPILRHYPGLSIIMAVDRLGPW